MRAQPVLSDEKKLFLGHAGRQANAPGGREPACDPGNIAVARPAMQKSARERVAAFLVDVHAGLSMSGKDRERDERECCENFGHDGAPQDGLRSISDGRAIPCKPDD